MATDSSSLQDILMEAFLTGEDRNFRALTRQYLHTKNKKGRRLSFCLRNWKNQLHQRGHRLFFDVDWGCGSEDYILGDRRPFVLRDVIARLDNGSMLCSELLLNHGRLYELRLLGVFTEPGEALFQLKRWPKKENLNEIIYTDSWDPQYEAPAAYFKQRQIKSPYGAAANRSVLQTTPIQQWFLELTDTSIPVAAASHGLELRLAQPASSEEIADFEEHNEFALPADVKDMWRVSNGCSFFGDKLYGTYDAPLHRKRDQIEIVLLERTQVPGHFIVANIHKVPGGQAVTYSEIDIDAQKTIETWPDLQSGLEQVLEQHT